MKVRTHDLQKELYLSSQLDCKDLEKVEFEFTAIFTTIFQFQVALPCRLTESFGNSMIARLGFDRENRRYSEQEHVSAVLASRIS